MALTTTLGELVEAVQRTADVVAFTDKHPVVYVKELVNRGLGALSRICRTTNPEFQPIASSPITTDGIETLYSLPGNFRSLISVEYTDADSRKAWLVPYEMHERAALSSPEERSSSLRARHYKVIGSNIELLPRAPADHVARLWYATTVTQLSDTGPAFDTMERLDDYVIWYAAREIAQERENWPRYDRLTASMGALEADIRILARSVDLSHPARVVDARRGSVRYR